MHRREAAAILRRILESCIERKVMECTGEAAEGDQCRDRRMFIYETLICVYDSVAGLLADLCKVIDSRWLDIVDEIEAAYDEVKVRSE